MFDVCIPCRVQDNVHDNDVRNLPNVPTDAMDKGLDDTSAATSTVALSEKEILTLTAKSSNFECVPIICLSPSFAVTSLHVPVREDTDTSATDHHTYSSTSASASATGALVDAQQSMSGTLDSSADQPTESVLMNVASCRHFLRLVVTDSNGASNWNTTEVFFYRNSLKSINHTNVENMV